MHPNAHMLFIMAQRKHLVNNSHYYYISTDQEVFINWPLGTADRASLSDYLPGKWKRLRPSPVSTKFEGESWRVCVGQRGQGREGEKHQASASPLESLGSSQVQLQLLEWTAVSGRVRERGAAGSEHSCIRQSVYVAVNASRGLWHVGETHCPRTYGAAFLPSSLPAPSMLSDEAAGPST